MNHGGTEGTEKKGNLGLSVSSVSPWFPSCIEVYE